MCHAASTVSTVAAAAALLKCSYVCKSQALYSPGWRAVFGLIKPGESFLLHSRMTAAIQSHLKGMGGNYQSKATARKQRMLGRYGPWTGEAGDTKEQQAKWRWL